MPPCIRLNLPLISAGASIITEASRHTGRSVYRTAPSTGSPPDISEHTGSISKVSMMFAPRMLPAVSEL